MTYKEKLTASKLKNISGIYKLLINQECYIGSAVNLEKRLRQHCNALMSSTHVNRHLQSAFNKYNDLDFEIIEFVSDKRTLVDREQFFIDTIFPRYNIAPKAGSMLGFKHSEKSKVLISKVQMGRKLSDEAKKNMSESRKGMKFSESARKNMSLSKMGNKNPFYKAGKNHPQYGTKRKDSTILKLSGKNSHNSKTGELYDCENNCSYIFRCLKTICKLLELPYRSVLGTTRRYYFYQKRWKVTFIQIPEGVETIITNRA